MYGILLSAFNSVLAWLVRTVLVKFIVFTALYLIVSAFIAVLATWLPSSSSLNGAFGGVTAEVWYFLDMFAFSVGLPMIISAYLTRFAIRRVPVIG